MNIKSLLLGSAAALVAVSGARAADAVMAPEPEPVEYVRVCDAYGAGFFYIPGTETCLKISGYVWYQIGTSNYTAASIAGTGPATMHFALGGETWQKSVRARVNFDARSETEWGTLRSYIRFQATWNGVGDGPVTADQAYIELGGFKMGYSESFWVDSGNGGASNYGSHSWSGMSYGYQQRALIGYRFESNGFFGAISLEDDAGAGDGYIPDVVAKIGYTGGWGTVWAKVGFDESANEWGAQVGTQINMPNMPGSSLRVIGFFAGGPSAYTVVPAHLFFTDTDWSVLVSYNQQFSETLGVSVGVQYFDDVQSGIPNQDIWEAELSVVWFPVKDFEVRGELAWRTSNLGALPGSDSDASGFLRFTRYF